jgi:hypothetical protein
MDIISREDALAQGLKRYFTGKPCKRGHLAERRVPNQHCCQCSRENSQKPRKRSEGRAEADRKRSRLYYQVNKQQVITAQVQRKREKRASDPEFRARHSLRNRMWNAVKRAKAWKAGGTAELIGCSREQLLSHLEAQFADGMTWDNYGEWHIDHIRPCASFDLTDPAQQRECFHYTNLQPLWAQENQRKWIRH